MKPIRSILDDLVERRLWPFALVLIAGLIAVPVVLAKHGAPVVPPAPVVAAAPADSALAVAPLDASTPVVSTASGRELAPLGKHNPFDQHAPKTTKATGSTAGPSQAGPSTASTPGGGTTPSSGPGTDPGTSGGGGGLGPSAPIGPVGPSGPTPPAAPTYTVARLDLRLGYTDHTRPYDDVPRLSPLPTATNPIAVYLGLLPNTRTAEFLLPSNVHAEGDGTCRPSPTNCQTLSMRPGDREFLTAPNKNGRLVEYQLDIVRVTYERTRSRAVAGAAFVHRARRKPKPRGGRVASAASATSSAADALLAG